ncbi:MAG: glycosyltransferase [Planctomycetes bacterium]|nr:glycosyltransferase [Planctomycetota bacterium]
METALDTERAKAAAQQRLRVVHVVYWFGTGGLEKGVDTLIRRTADRIDHEVISLAGDIPHHLPGNSRQRVLGKKPGNSLRSVLRLAGWLRDLRPCVVHTRNWSGIDGILAARLAGIRAVVHGEHGWGVDDPDGTNPRRRRIRRFLSRWVRTTISVSKDIETWLRDDVRLRCPVVQIYNGIDTETFAPAPTGDDVRRELGAPPGAPLILCVGRLDPIKDHGTLFRAFARVRERFPEARLLCVGEGKDRARVEAAKGPGVHLLGNRTDVPRLLQAADVFALASLNEGISNTILEAMATGLPVVATRVGGNPELVVDGETGRLFTPGDDLALAEAVAGYLADPALRAAHGRAGRARCEERFGVDAMVRAYEAIWRSVA